MKQLAKLFTGALGFISGVVLFLFFITPAVQAQERTMDRTLSFVAPTTRTDGAPLALNEIAGYILSYRMIGEGYPWIEGDLVIGLSHETGLFTLPEDATGMEWRVKTRDTDGAENGWSLVLQDIYKGKPNAPSNLRTGPKNNGNSVTNRFKGPRWRRG